MAFWTALFGILSRKVGGLIRVVFGWSVAALFGRLSVKNQTILSMAVGLSLVWPFLILGVFVPSRAAQLLAFVPVEGLAESNAMREVWAVMAVLSPPLVGVLTRLVSPDARRPSLLRSVFQGFPLSVGYAAGFIIALVTVPVVKLSTLARGWTDQHVDIYAKPDKSMLMLQMVCDACAMAGLEPRAAVVPLSMALSTRVITWFSRGAIDSLVTSTPLMVRAIGAELFLYPGDLLIRGQKDTVRRLRSMLNRTTLEQVAYLVESDDAKRLQDELCRLWDAIARHDTVSELGPQLKARLKQIVEDTATAKMTYEEVATLERLAGRLELALLNIHSIIEEAGVKTSFADVRKQSIPEGHNQLAAAVVGETSRPPTIEPSTVQLVEAVMRDGRELIQLELALAKQEVIEQSQAAAKALIALAVAYGLVVVALAVLGTALVLALGGTSFTALGVAGACLAAGLVTLGVGWSQMPHKPLEKSRRHLQDDFQQITERFA